MKLSERQHSTKMPQHRIKRHTLSAIYNNAQEHTAFIISRRSIANERHPMRNEDYILVDEQSGLVAVFDGVGGSAAAEIASQTAARATHQGWKRHLMQQQKRQKFHTMLEDCDKEALSVLLRELILESDEQVRTEGAKRAGTDDLATTVALVALSRNSETKEYTMVHAHVGDSRIYLLRGDEELQRLTNDDGLLTKLVENQIINELDAFRIDQAMNTDQLSDIEYSYFRLRGGITQALGGPLPPTIHIDRITIYPGDRILLCTDGIHDNLTDEEIEDTLRNCPRTTSARVLVERSLRRSHEDRASTIRSKPDDMSAVVMTCRF